MEPRTSQKEVPQPPRVHTARIAKNSAENIDKFIGPAFSISVPQSPRKRCFSAYGLGIKWSTQYPDLVFGSIGQNVLSPILVRPILR